MEQKENEIPSITYEEACNIKNKAEITYTGDLRKYIQDDSTEFYKLAMVWNHLKENCMKILKAESYNCDLKVECSDAKVLKEYIKFIPILIETQNSLKKISLIFRNANNAEQIEEILNKFPSTDQLEKFNIQVEQGWLSSFNNQSLASVRTAISRCMNLRILVLDSGYNKITDIGLKALSAGIGNCKNISSLTLYFVANEITDIGLKALSAGIGNCKNISLLTLYFDRNDRITDIGLKALSVGIANCKNISSLRLGFDQNEITDIGLKSLNLTIANSPNLYSLNLLFDENDRITNYGFYILSRGIRNCPKLKELIINLGDPKCRSNESDHLDTFTIMKRYLKTELKELTEVDVNLDVDDYGGYFYDSDDYGIY